MIWLGANGDPLEKVVGYGYRTVPIYTNMTDASYGLQSGTESGTFLKLLKGIQFSSNKNDADDLRHFFGVKYILSSEKLVANLGGTLKNSSIDKNLAVNKIYSSKDFGVYEITGTSQKNESKTVLAQNIILQNTGSSFEVETDDYKVILNEYYPTIERFGTSQENYLGMGFILDNVRIYGMGLNSTVDQFLLNDVAFTQEIKNNQIIYNGVLKGQQNKGNEASIQVRYTFYPQVIKREFLISNDWISLTNAPQMKVGFSTTLFLPMTDFIITNDQLRQERHIYPSDDGITKNEMIENVYIHDDKRGMNIKYGTTAPFPTSLTYKGSTIYNMSSITFSQTDYLKPGATLHLTQFISRGGEATAKQKINSQEGISLMNYPDGIVPIIIAGYRTPVSDLGNLDNIDKGYKFLNEEKIPYTEIINPLQKTENTFDENATEIQNSTSLVINPLNLTTLSDNDIKIIGSQSTRD